jgi:vacuolar-type H+-ATPase subunit I/STV1
MAFLFTLVAIGLNAAIFFVAQGTRALLWLSVLAGLVALVYGFIGIQRAFGRPQLFGGKVSSSIFGILALLVCGLMAFSWFGARAMPASAGAPHAGKKAPEFTLADTQGNEVSLSQLLGQANATGGSSAAPPKAVLLIFYRGYW